MAQMVLRKKQLLFPVEGLVETFELFSEQSLLEQLLFQPDGHSHPKRIEAARRKCQVGFQKALELQKRLVIEYDVVDLFEGNTSLSETVRNRVLWKRRVMFLACETLLLGCRNNPSFSDHRGSAVMIERRYTQNSHDLTLENGQNSVYMKGAMAEPWTSTSRPPSNVMTIIIGSSQSFFRACKNCHNSLNIIIYLNSELVLE